MGVVCSELTISVEEYKLVKRVKITKPSAFFKHPNRLNGYFIQGIRDNIY